MAAMSAASLQDALRGFLGKAEHNGSRWFLVAIGVVILLRLRLILFAAALPVMAYWHYSNQQQEAAAKEEAPGDDGDEADQAEEYPPRAGHRDDYDDDRPEPGRRPSVPKEEEEGDPYDDAFWSQDKQDAGEPRRTAPWRSAETSSSTAARPSTDFKKNLRPDDHLDLGFDDLDSALDSRKPDLGFSWDGGRDELDDLLGGGDLGGSRSRPSTGLGNNRSGTDSMLDELAGLGSRGRGGMDDFDFLGGGGGGDMDFFSGGFGGGGKGKGKGKSKDGGKGKDPMAPREANPKQVFVANVGDLPEDDIRSYFDQAGEVDRLKVLRNPDGGSKGVCFVTFRTEEQAQKALSLHNSTLDGRNIVVRLAHGGNPVGKDGGKGKGDGMDFGGGGGGGFSRPGGGGRDGGPGAMDLGGSERFGAAFGFGGADRYDNRGSSKGGGKSKGGRGGKGDRGEMDELLEEALADGDGPIRAGDFDFAARRFLGELRNRDKADSGTRYQEAMDMVVKYTSSKDRSSVRKWPAYIFTLLQKFDPALGEEMRERDAERRAQKGGGKGDRDRGGDRPDRDRRSDHEREVANFRDD